MSKWIVRDGIFVTMDQEQPLVRGWMAVEGDRIAALGEGEPPTERLAEAAETIDGRQLLFMPGLINTHGHAAMSLLRGYADDLALQDWLANHMWPMEAKFTGDDVYWGASLAAVEMIKSGTTTFLDMYDHMDRVGQVVDISGMRAVLTRGMIGAVPEAEQKAKLEDAVSFAKGWHGAADGRIRVMMSPHAPYTCPPDFIEQVVDIAHKLDLPLHTHMSETAFEVEQNVQDYGLRPPEHLDKLGFFSRPALLAHAVHLTDDEIALLAERGAAVSHNPVSNLKLASGVARVPQLLAAGVSVGLGTDSAASNNNLDLFEEVRLAALLHKGVTGDPTVMPAAEALRMGTVYGADALGLGGDGGIGCLKPGMKADMIAVSTANSRFVPHTDMISHLVYSAVGADVRHVWVDGRCLMRDGQLTTLDEERICYEAQACFERLKG